MKRIKDLWQSQVEIEHYFVAYFARIAAFEVLLRGTSVKGGAHMCWVNSSTLAMFIQHVCMSPALNGSSALQRFKRSNASEICNGIMFDFYPGLPHVFEF